MITAHTIPILISNFYSILARREIQIFRVTGRASKRSKGVVGIDVTRSFGHDFQTNLLWIVVELDQNGYLNGFLTILVAIFQVTPTLGTRVWRIVGEFTNLFMDPIRDSANARIDSRVPLQTTSFALHEYQTNDIDTATIS